VERKYRDKNKEVWLIMHTYHVYAVNIIIMDCYRVRRRRQMQKKLKKKKTKKVRSCARERDINARVTLLKDY